MPSQSSQNSKTLGRFFERLYRLSSSTVFVICRVVVWSLSLTVVCGHLSEFVVCGHLLSVVIHCLWLSVVCGHPSSVVVRHLWLSVVCSCPSFVVVCHLWLSIACRSLLSIIVCCLLSLGNCTGITRGYPPLFKQALEYPNRLRNG